MKRSYFIFLLVCFISTFTFGQQEIEFGEIDMADMTMTEYPSDSSAVAAILYDKGSTFLDYEKGIGAFRYTYDRHLRIKILDKAGLDWADFSISLYENGRSQEKVSKFTGAVYTNKNGQIVETTVNKKDLLAEQVSENYSQKKIAFPNVQVGSIIEIKYRVSSPFYYSLVDWQFQYEIPVRYSDYSISYPEWFTYKTKFKGYALQHITPLDLLSSNNSIVFTSKSGSNRIDFTQTNAGWIAKDMPAFKKEAYISTVDNFLVSIDFELASTNIPGSNWVSLAKTWQELGATMMDADGFGKQFTKGKIKFLADEVKTITANLATPKEKISAIYDHLKHKMTWNEYQNKFVSSSLKEAYNKGKGNTADINLTLLGMLRQAGFTADPVLLSTKGNGFLNQGFPALRQFNYVIIRVEIEPGKYMLLDATAKDLPIHLLPTKCINNQGLVVRKEGIKWVDLKPTGKYSLTCALDLVLNEEMEWVGEMKVRCKDYAANVMRTAYTEADNEAAYIAAMESDYEGLSVDDYSIDGIETIGKGIKESCQVNFSNQLMDGGDLLYFNPMLDFATDENPFKLEERTYPIDYPYPQSKTYSLQYEIPAGYVVEEVPEKTLIALPEKGGQFSYSVKVQGGKIMVLSQFKINKNLFLPTEYQALKEFYNIVVAKQAEQIVLKKA